MEILCGNPAERGETLFSINDTELVRGGEKDGNIHLVTNMLEIAVRQYKRPQYAEKLGDTNTLIKMYCDRMKEEIWWWAMPEYSLLPKVKQLIDSGHITPETAEYYKNTLIQLQKNYPKYVKRNQEWLHIK